MSYYTQKNMVSLFLWKIFEIKYNAKLLGWSSAFPARRKTLNSQDNPVGGVLVFNQKFCRIFFYINRTK